jgi:hypothetical protein
MKLFLDKGADVNGQAAQWHERIELAELLLERGRTRRRRFVTFWIMASYRR